MTTGFEKHRISVILFAGLAEHFDWVDWLRLESLALSGREKVSKSRLRSFGTLYRGLGVASTSISIPLAERRRFPADEFDDTVLLTIVQSCVRRLRRGVDVFWSQCWTYSPREEGVESAWSADAETGFKREDFELRFISAFARLAGSGSGSGCGPASAPSFFER